MRRTVEMKCSRNRVAIACDHFNNGVLSTVLLHWRLHTLHNIKNSQMKGIIIIVLYIHIIYIYIYVYIYIYIYILYPLLVHSISYCNSQLMNRYFTNWRLSLKHKQYIDVKVDVHYCTSLCNKCLQRWIMCEWVWLVAMVLLPIIYSHSETATEGCHGNESN